MRWRLIVWGLGVWLVVLTGCPHKAPYGVGKKPDVETLMRATRPQLDAVQVSNAKLLFNRAIRGDLAFLAQTPGRFRGTVTKAGNELVTLAVHEEGYGLVYKLGDLPTGFYEGPPSECAVERLLGVPLTYDNLAATVLGGGPVIAPPHEVVEQKWDRKHGYERLVIRNAQFVEELRFVWVAETWQFGGAVLYQVGQGRKVKGARIWELQNDKFERKDGALLPAKTRILSPRKRGDNRVVITYKSRELDPAFAKQGSAGDGGAEGGADGGADGGWDDDGGWEDDGEWEGDGPEPEAEPEPEPEAEPEPAAKPAGKKSGGVPAVFKLDGKDLTARGDLCR